MNLVFSRMRDLSFRENVIRVVYIIYNTDLNRTIVHAQSFVDGKIYFISQ